ncbi:MAG: aminodeoxychorismate synthase component I [Betaproteobacteria bacterium]|nr:aminodeoxychorismate synthase component I [Betaproteobacteria bacterium]
MRKFPDPPHPLAVSTTSVPYQPDCEPLAARLAALPWSLWLDSGHPLAAGGRYDILLAFPAVTLEGRGGTTRVTRAAGGEEIETGDPFALLRRELAALGRWSGPAPFVGGAAGYFGYDLGVRQQGLPSHPRADALPELALGLYPGALVMDHATGRGWISVRPDAAGQAWRERMLAALHAFPASPRGFVRGFVLESALVADPTPEAYAQAFQRVQDYIRAGDCYQVNLAQRLVAPCSGSPWPLYCALRRRNPAPFAAWMNLPCGQVLSSSPERFLALRDGLAETRPIKGTRPRRADPAQDAREVAELSASPKDRAENLMIVDLLRNDLGRVCRPGSIRVPDLFRVEHYATVHHLVSTVIGELGPGRDALDLLAAAFPGGSITGAPKRRAMEIIAELEPRARGVYCGSLGYLGADGAMDLNIAIRTLTVAAGEVSFWAGGGLVADSRCEAEFRECQDKARALREALEGFLRA